MLRIGFKAESCVLKLYSLICQGFPAESVHHGYHGSIPMDYSCTTPIALAAAIQATYPASINRCSVLEAITLSSRLSTVPRSERTSAPSVQLPALGVEGAAERVQAERGERRQADRQRLLRAQRARHRAAGQHQRRQQRQLHTVRPPALHAVPAERVLAARVRCQRSRGGGAQEGEEGAERTRAPTEQPATMEGTEPVRA